MRLIKDKKMKLYLEELRNKLMQDPQWEEKQEFGRFLMRHIGSLSPNELKRYDELKEILRPTK